MDKNILKKALPSLVLDTAFGCAGIILITGGVALGSTVVTIAGFAIAFFSCISAIKTGLLALKARHVDEFTNAQRRRLPSMIEAISGSLWSFAFLAVGTAGFFGKLVVNLTKETLNIFRARNPQEFLDHQPIRRVFISNTEFDGIQFQTQIRYA